MMMTKKNTLLFAIFLGITPSVLATNTPTYTQLKKPEISVSYNFLAQNFKLTESLLNINLQKKHHPQLEHLLKIYRAFPTRNPFLTDLAEAKVAEEKGDIKKALHFYESALHYAPEHPVLLFQFANLLLKDKQYKRAEKIFQQVSKNENLPLYVKNYLAQIKNYLTKQQSWSFNGAISYLRETNINETSDNDMIISSQFFEKISQNIKNCDDDCRKVLKKWAQKEQPQHAHGLNYYLSGKKDWNLATNHFFTFESSLFGKYYWDKHDYDDLNLKLSSGYAYKDYLQQLSLTPFIQRRFIADHRYEIDRGLQFNYRRYIHNMQWSLNVSGRKKGYQYAPLNGHEVHLSTSFLWQVTPSFYSFLGAGFNREKAQDNIYSKDTHTFYTGLGKDWTTWQLSSQVNFSYALKLYKEKQDVRFSQWTELRPVRKDKLFDASLILWKRDFKLWHVLPKLQFKYHKTKSNIPHLYSYDEKNLNLFFEWDF